MAGVTSFFASPSPAAPDCGERAFHPNAQQPFNLSKKWRTRRLRSLPSKGLCAVSLLRWLVPPSGPRTGPAPTVPVFARPHLVIGLCDKGT